MKYKYLLAPLAGVTDPIFRYLCSQMGADLTFTEMVSADGLSYSGQKTARLLEKYPGETNVGVQIFGNKIPSIINAVKIINDYDFVMLDFNAGCPVKKVFNNGSGSALLGNLAHLETILETIKKHSRHPVSLKIRTGIKSSENVVPDIVKISEGLELSFLTIHGRSREQMFSGTADWEKIKEAVELSKIPIVGNGDIFSAQDAIDKMEQSGVQSVMIGRGVLGNPFIFRHLQAGQNQPVSVKEKLSMGLRQFELLLEKVAEHLVVKEMRKHWGWYSKGFRDSASFRRDIYKFSTADDVKKYVNNYIEVHQNDGQKNTL